MDMLKKMQDWLLALTATNVKKMVSAAVAGTVLATAYLQFDGKLDPLWDKLKPKKAVAAEVFDPFVPNPAEDVPVVAEAVEDVVAAPAVEESPPQIDPAPGCPDGMLNLHSTTGELVGCVMTGGSNHQ